MSQGALSIKLRCASWQQLATIYKRDLSRGSMFLRAATPPPVGTSVRIDLTLPSASVIVLTGVVQHHVSDPQRGTGVELKLAPIPTGSIWLIESALASEQRKSPTPSGGVPAAPLPPTASGPVAAVGEGEDMAAAEAELVRALMAEAESLKKLNPFLVLGVGYEANDAEVRIAFGELTKRYHPDRFARFDSAELRQLAAEIFILIRDAYRKLGDATGRSQMLQQLGRTSPPRAVPAPRPQPAGGSPPPGSKTAQAIPTRAITDPKSGPVPMAVSMPQRTQPVPGLVRRPLAGNDPPAPQADRRVAHGQTEKAPVLSDTLDAAAVEDLIDAGKLDEALAAYKLLVKKHPQDRTMRAGVELCEGLRAIAARDRLEAAQRFESALEIDPSNERAARELADMRRQATNERKGLLSRLMGKKEP